MKKRAREAECCEIIRKLFLNLSWEARQQAKRLFTKEQQTLLAEVLEGEPNW